MARDEPVWPMYFAAKPLPGKRRSYQVGDAFEIQTKEFVRGLGEAYGVKDALTRPFSQLEYCTVLNVRSPRNARDIATRGLRVKEAAKLVEA
jgi:hypothetical protein